MFDTLTIVGNVATDPVLGTTGGGAAVTNFRVASPQRRFDSASQRWVESGTNWYSVAAYRNLAEHAKASLRSGDSVIITGKLKIRNWESNGKHGTSIDIDADVIGHDLRWGTSAYARAARSSEARPQAPSGDHDVSGAEAPTADAEDTAALNAAVWGTPASGADSAGSPDLADADATPY